jgi:hypothetical protein
MNESEEQFSFTRVVLSAGGRAKNQIPVSVLSVFQEGST